MAIPATTCSGDYSLTYSVDEQNVSLYGIGTESADSYVWTILDVPIGSSAMSGVRGDFTDGVAILQSPDFITEAGIEGTYVIQCVASGVTGFSDPSIDRENAQQNVKVKTEELGLSLGGDYQYNWGDDNTNNFRLLEDISVDITAIESNIDNIENDISSLQTTVSGYYHLKDTLPPMGEWKTTSTVDFYARPNQNTSVRITLQDDIQRSFTGTLNWDHANGVNDLGWDETASSAAGDKWIYFYLTNADAELLTIVASDNPPAIGPTNRTNYEHIWSTYRTSGNLVEINQAGNVFFLNGEASLYALSSHSSESTFQTVDLSTFIPVDACYLYSNGRLRGASGEDWFHQVSSDGSGAMGTVRDTGSSYGIIFYNELSLPVFTAQTIYRRVLYVSGSGPTTANIAGLWMRGWRSKTIKA